MTPQMGHTSIRVRMALWFALATFALVAGAAATIRAVVDRALTRELERRVSDAALLIRHFYAADLPEYRTPLATLTHVASEVRLADRRLRFLGPNGVVLAVARGPADSTELAPPLRVDTLPVDHIAAPGWYVMVEASAADVVRVRRRIDAVVLATLVLGVLAAALVGWWVAGRTLRPVSAMADAAGRITPREAAERLPIANAHDELGRLGTAFNTLLDRLGEALAQQRRFVAEAAHELRTPLARLRARVDLAVDARSPAGEVLPGVRDEIGRMTVVVDELLQLARLDAAPGTLTRAPVFLDDLVMDAVRRHTPAATASGVRLVTTDVEETPMHGDAALLTRMLDVLLDNAVRYTPRGGLVSVSVRDGDGTARIDVSDTGIGIPPDERERVTERFFRGRLARAAAPDGSGLGLAIAHGIVVRHGGSLGIEPAPGSGTIVRVTFPASEGDPPGS